MVKNLSDLNVNVQNIKRVEGVSTGIAVIILSQNDNRIILDKGANGHVCEKDVDLFLGNANEGDIFLTQLEIPIKVVGYALKKAKEKKLITILNPAPATKDVVEYLKDVDIITPNETEMEILGGKNGLIDCGIEKIITTLGGKGYEICDGKNITAYPCIKVTPVDTTAAGDTFCGGLAVGLANGDSLENACKYGSKAASIACTKKGAQMSIPTKEEVLN